MLLNNLKQKGSTKDLKKALAFRGLCRAVAERLEITPQFVSQVVHGKRNTKQVREAIEQEYQRRKRELENEDAA